MSPLRLQYLKLLPFGPLALMWISGIARSVGPKLVERADASMLLDE